MLKLSLLVLAVASANAPPSAYAQIVTYRESFTRAATRTEAHTFDQPIDPRDASVGTFKQRYFVDSSRAAGADSPVFLYLCGESECHPESFQGFVGTLADRFHAHIVSLEHRYYGESKPFAKLTRDNIRYLTAENALADLARFQTAITKENHWTGRWVAVGGSYAGSLAAYYRLTHPELVVGALASSAPVEARYHFPEFDFHAATQVPESCRQSVLSANLEIEKALDSPAEIARLEKLFNAEDIRDARDFLFFAADFAAEDVQYGYGDRLCQGIDPEHPLESYATYVTNALAETMMHAQANTYEPTLDEHGAVVLEGSEWTYQSCREFGYWQTAYANVPQSMRSQAIRTEDFTRYCDELFGITDGGAAAIEATNQRYYEKLQDPKLASRILFTNGSQDPWSELSIADFRHNHLNPNVQTLLIDGGSHCSDLRRPESTDSPALLDAREKIAKTVQSWLAN